MFDILSFLARGFFGGVVGLVLGIIVIVFPMCLLDLWRDRKMKRTPEHLLPYYLFPTKADSDD